MRMTEVVFVVVAALILLALSRWVLQWILGQTLQEMLTAHDNPAIGLVVAGYFFGVLWTIMALLGSPSQGFWRDVLGVLLYGCLGIVLLTAVALVSSRYFLGLQVREHLEARNCAAAVVVAAVYVATSLTYSGALTGEGGGFWILLLFFVLGQLALLGITYVFRWLTTMMTCTRLPAAISLPGTRRLTDRCRCRRGACRLRDLYWAWQLARQFSHRAAGRGGVLSRTPGGGPESYSWCALCTGAVRSLIVKLPRIKMSPPDCWKLWRISPRRSS